MLLETLSIRFFIGKYKLQFAVTHLQFHVAEISILARHSLFSAAMFFFTKSRCINFIAQKTRTIH